MLFLGLIVCDKIGSSRETPRGVIPLADPSRHDSRTRLLTIRLVVVSAININKNTRFSYREYFQ